MIAIAGKNRALVSHYSRYPLTRTTLCPKHDTVTNRKLAEFDEIQDRGASAYDWEDVELPCSVCGQ